MSITYIPNFIRSAEDMKSGDKVTAEKWNAVHNLLVTQGDKNSETINEIVELLNGIDGTPILIPFKTIENSYDLGTRGEMCCDASYIYICVDTNSWKRIPIEGWGGL